MLTEEECAAMRKRWTGDIGSAAQDVLRLLDDRAELLREIDRLKEILEIWSRNLALMEMGDDV
jgi:hypothetical protein